MNVEERLQQIVNQFVSQVSDFARQVAMETLAGAFSPRQAGRAPIAASRPARTARGPADTTKAKASRGGGLPKGAERDPAEIEEMQTKLLEFIASNPGQRVEQINAALRTKTPEVSLPLKKLIKTKAIKTKGARRGTTYFPL